MIKIQFKKNLIIFAATFLILTLAGIVAYKIMNSRTFQFYGGIVNKISTEDKVVAITFDDGPSQKVDTILSILNSENVKATFFLVGNSIEKYPEETKKLIAAGHEIGNHTYSHKPMVFKTPSYIKEEIEKTDNLIREMGYKEPIQFRPPNGKKLVFLPYYLNQHDRKTILWNLEPNSYPEVNSSSDKIAEYVIDNVQPGSIILLHPMYDNNEATLGAIKGIIDGLRNKGYKFKTVNELLPESNNN